MLAVVDVNVIVSGLIWQGPSGRVVQAIRSGLLELVMSEALLHSLTDVLGRNELRERLQLTGRSLSDSLADVRGWAVVLDVPPPVVQVARDQDDDLVLACATYSGADIIVTGDKDLLVLREFKGIAIMSPVDCLRTLGLE